jgi:hypothetical protein
MKIHALWKKHQETPHSFELECTSCHMIFSFPGCINYTPIICPACSAKMDGIILAQGGEHEG